MKRIILTFAIAAFIGNAAFAQSGTVKSSTSTTNSSVVKTQRQDSTQAPVTVDQSKQTTDQNNTSYRADSRTETTNTTQAQKNQAGKTQSTTTTTRTSSSNTAPQPTQKSAAQKTPASQYDKSTVPTPQQ